MRQEADAYALEERPYSFQPERHNGGIISFSSFFKKMSELVEASISVVEGDDNDSEADGRWRRRLAAPSGFRNEGAADSSQSGRAGNLLLADAIVCVCPRFGLGGALLLGDRTWSRRRQFSDF